MRTLFAISILISFISCRQEKKHALEYLLAWKNRGDIDTIYMDIDSRQSTDSFDIINYKVTWDKRKYSPYEQVYKLPKYMDSIGFQTVRLVLEKTISFEGKEYKVLKYQYDEKGGDDEESLYFYSPEFGIILFHWGTHRNSQRLVRTGDEQNDKIIYYLTENIENDDQMTREWN